jgi:hypothetical protein
MLVIFVTFLFSIFISSNNLSVFFRKKLEWSTNQPLQSINIVIGRNPTSLFFPAADSRNYTLEIKSGTQTSLSIE